MPSSSFAGLEPTLLNRSVSYERRLQADAQRGGMVGRIDKLRLCVTGVAAFAVRLPNDSPYPARDSPEIGRLTRRRATPSNLVR